MRQRLTIVVAALGLVISACGTRLSDSAFQKAQQRVGTNGGQQASGSDQNGASSDLVGGATATGSDATGAAGSGGAGGTGASGPGGGPGGAGGGGAGAVGPGGNTASDVGVTPTSIKIGNITAVGGALGPDAFGVSLHGLRVAIQAINDRGGVNGRKLILDTCDDERDGTKNLACAQKLIDQDKVFVNLVNNSDAGPASANFEYKRGVPDLSFPLHNGYYKYPNEFSIYGTGYVRDGKTVGENNQVENQTGTYRYFKQQAHVDRAAVFYYSIDVSKQAGCFIEKGLKIEGIPTVYEGGGGNGNCSGAGENLASPQFDTDVINMKQKGVQGVWDGMDVSGNERLCQAMDRQGFKVIAKVSTIEVWGDTVGSDWSSPCRNSVYADGSSDSYDNTGNPRIAQFRSELQKYHPEYKLHQWTVEGWGITYMFADYLKTAGATPTRKGFMDWLNSLRQYNGGGLWTPFDYKRVDYSKPAPNCNIIVQWQDSAHGYVTHEPTTYCPVTNWFPSPVTDDGS